MYINAYGTKTQDQSKNCVYASERNQIAVNIEWAVSFFFNVAAQSTLIIGWEEKQI